MKALVTGGDGLLGSHLVRELLDRGHQVTVFVQPKSDSPTLDGLPVELVEGDLLDGGAILAEAMGGCEQVFHLAAITDLWARPELVWKVNLEGTRKVLEACCQEEIGRLVFVGSASSFQFGPMERPGDEEGSFPEAYRGIAYMESKYQAMELVRSHVRRRGLDAVIVAPTFMLGAHDSRPSSGELIRRFVDKGMSYTAPGGRSFACASDVAGATASAAERGRSGEAYILGGENLSYLDFFTTVARVAGIDPPRGVLPRPLLLGAGAAGSLAGRATARRVPFDLNMARLSLCDTYYSPDKAVRELGMPMTPVETGIADSIGGLRRYGHLAPRRGDFFTGKVALVSGASRGVGLATARKLVQRGARVVMTARGARRLEISRDELERMGGEVLAVAGDITDLEDVKRMVRAAVDRFGRLDILVNNAGVSMRGSFADLSYEVCRQTLMTNLVGSVYLTRAAIEHLIEARGQVVFVSSVAGLFGLPGASTYCAGKGGLTGLCESLRLELDRQGVHCGVVHLGFTEHDPEKRILSADGSLVPPARPAHHSQARAADGILEMLEKRRRKVVMTPIGMLGDLAYRASPRLVEWLVGRAQASRWGIFRRFS